MENPQLKGANFRGKNGMVYLVKCYKCGGEYGTENYAAAVSSGICAWCGDDANVFDTLNDIVSSTDCKSN